MKKCTLHLLNVLYIPIQLDYLGRIPEQAQLGFICERMIQSDDYAYG